MKLLLDTRVLLWAASEPEQLTDQARDALEDGTNDVLVKLDLPKPAEQWLPPVLRRTGFELAEVGLATALRVRALPWHHRDPFDRLLVAQAVEDGYTVVTRDSALVAYGVPLLKA